VDGLRLSIKNKAYSIIELIIVIAIIAILATLAVGAYTTQMMRSKIAEGISLLDQYARQYEEYYGLYGYLPKSMAETLIASPNSANVSQIWAGSNSSQGTGMFLYAIYQDSLGFGINNRIVLILIPDSTKKVIIKHCGQWQNTLYVPVTYLPSTCNETAMSATYAAQLVN
jgi:prepilin-type N-terminal cleavage/methylation domain-containing protein